MDHSSRIYVAGHTGLIGSALKRSLPTPALRCLRGIARQLMFPLNLGAVKAFQFASLLRPSPRWLAMSKNWNVTLANPTVLLGNYWTAVACLILVGDT